MIRRLVFNPLGSRATLSCRSHTTYAPVGHGSPEKDGDHQISPPNKSPTTVTPFYSSCGSIQLSPQWYDSSISHSTPIPSEWVPLLEGHKARNLLDSNRWLNRAQAHIIGKPYYGSSRLSGTPAPNLSHKAAVKSAKLVVSESLSSFPETPSSSSQNSVSKNASKSRKTSSESTESQTQSAKKDKNTATNTSTNTTTTTTVASPILEEDAYNSFGKIFIQDQQSATGKSWGSRGANGGSPSFNVGNVGIQVPLVGVPRKAKTVFFNELSSDVQMHLWNHHPLPATLLASPTSSSASPLTSCGKTRAPQTKEDVTQTQDKNSSLNKENNGHKGGVTIVDYPCVTAGAFQQPVWVLDLTYMEESDEPNHSSSSFTSSITKIKKTVAPTSTNQSTAVATPSSNTFNKIGKEFETRYASWRGGHSHKKSVSAILEDDKKKTDESGRNDAALALPSPFVRPLNYNDRSLLPLCENPFLDRKVFLGVLRPEVWRTCLGEDQSKQGACDHGVVAKRESREEAEKVDFAESTPLEKLRDIIIMSSLGANSFDSSSKTICSSSSSSSSHSYSSSSSKERLSSLFFDPTKAHEVLCQVYQRREEFLACDAALPSPFGWTGAEIDGGTSKTDNDSSTKTATATKRDVAPRQRFFFWRPATHEELHEALLFYAAPTNSTVPTDMILVKSKYFSEKASHASQVTTIYNAQETTDPFSLDKTLVHRHALTNEPLPDRVAAGLTSAFSLRRFRNLRWLPVGEVGAGLNSAGANNYSKTSTNTKANQKVVAPAGGGSLLPFHHQHNDLAMAASCWRPLSDESPVIVEVKQEVALLHISQLPSDKLRKRLLSRLPSHFVGKSYAPIVRWGFDRWRAERSLTNQIERFFEKVEEYNKELERKAGRGHKTFMGGSTTTTNKNSYGALRVEAAKGKRLKEIIGRQQLAQQKLLPFPSSNEQQQHTKQKKKRPTTGKGEERGGQQEEGSHHNQGGNKKSENGTLASSSSDSLLPLRLPHYPPISIVESNWFNVDHLHDIFPASEVPSLEAIGSPVPFVYAYPCPLEFYNIEQLAYVPFSGSGRR